MQRIIGLDYLRIYVVLIIFLFHSWMNLGCTFGPFTSFISVGAIYMSMFFMLSGYVLFLKYKDLSTNASSLALFYLKRLISIMPAYWASVIIYVIFLSKESIAQNLLLFPIEMIGFQSVFSSLFSVSHNGGTWFISCLLLCYLFCPFVMHIINGLSNRSKIVLLISFSSMLILSPWIVYMFNTNEIYSNPLIRLMEFSIGILLASWRSVFDSNYKWLHSWISILGGYMMIFIAIRLLLQWNVPTMTYMVYSSLLLPLFMLQILSHTVCGNKNIVLTYAADISYAFFLTQLFVFKITKLILGENSCMEVMFIASFLLNILLAILLHEIIEKPVSRKLKSYFIVFL